MSAPRRARHLVQIDQADKVFAQEQADAEAARLAKKNKALIKENELGYEAKAQRAHYRYNMQLGLGMNKDASKAELKATMKRLKKQHPDSLSNMAKRAVGGSYYMDSVKDANQGSKKEKKDVYGERGIDSKKEKDLRKAFDKHDTKGTVDLVAGLVPGGSDAVKAARNAKDVKEGGARAKRGKRELKENIAEGVSHVAGGTRAAANVASDVAGTGALTEVPVLGLVAAGGDMAIKTALAAENAKHAAEHRNILKKTAGSEDNFGTRLALKNIMHTEENVAAHAGVDVAADSAKIAGDAATLSGVGAIAGVPTRLAGTALGLVNKAVKKGNEYNHEEEAVKGRKQMERKGAAKTANLGGEIFELEETEYTAKNEEKDGAKRIKHDLQLAVQIMINEGRDERSTKPGPASKTLDTFGIDSKMLADKDNTDKELRKLMLGHMGRKDERAETIGKQVAQSGVGRSFAKGEDQFDEIQAFAQAKNLMNYGGKSDRDNGYAWEHKDMRDVEAKKARLLMEFQRLQKETLASGQKNPFAGNAPQVGQLLKPWYVKDAEERKAKAAEYAARKVTPVSKKADEAPIKSVNRHDDRPQPAKQPSSRTIELDPPGWSTIEGGSSQDEGSETIKFSPSPMMSRKGKGKGKSVADKSAPATPYGGMYEDR